MSNPKHDQRGGYGCLTAEDSGIPQAVEDVEVGQVHQCSCGRWWIMREVAGFEAWQPMSEAEQAEHLPGEITNWNHAPHGDVCMGCSDPHAGRWVPVSRCGLAMTAFEDGSAFNTVMDKIRKDFE